MSYSYPTVLIQSTPFIVYQSLEDAIAYAIGSINAAAWLAMSADDQGRMLVTATRLFDRQCWLGTRTDDAQELEWPRKDTGIVGVSDDVIPVGILTGSIEMAFAFAAGSTAQDNPTPGAQTIQSLKAGSVAIQYFRGAEGVLAINRFPEIVQELVGKYACSSQRITGAFSSDTCGRSITHDDFDFNQGM